MLTGLWHGASWNFIFWGVFYGVILILEKLFLLDLLKKCPAWITHIYTMFIVLIAWVFFAFTDFSAGLRYLGVMFGNAPVFNGLTMDYLRNYIVLFVLCAVSSTPLFKDKLNILQNKKLAWAAPVLAVLCLLVCTAFIVDASYNPFLYFRF